MRKSSHLYDAFLESLLKCESHAAIDKVRAETWDWIRANVERSQNQPGGIWSNEYQALRQLAGCLIEVCGMPASSRGDRIIAEALDFSDRCVVAWAIGAAVRRGLKPPTSALWAAAKQPASRHILFEELRKLERIDIFPHQYLTHSSLAEAEMCSWLTYSTELGREPDELEQMAVVPLPDPTLDLYVFRFRMLGNHWAAGTGWLAAVAGPSQQPLRGCRLPSSARRRYQYAMELARASKHPARVGLPRELRSDAVSHRPRYRHDH
jgi:hypothetical protein